MRHMITALVLATSLALGGCSSVGSGLSSVAVSLTTKTETQAKTVAEATQAASLAERALDLYVQTGNPPREVLLELQILVPAVHNALVTVQNANRAGNSALSAGALASFNEALAALVAYQTLKGVPH